MKMSVSFGTYTGLSGSRNVEDLLAVCINLRILEVVESLPEAFKFVWYCFAFWLGYLIDLFYLDGGMYLWDSIVHRDLSH
jgi:hypothetical protein